MNSVPEYRSGNRKRQPRNQTGNSHHNTLYPFGISLTILCLCHYISTSFRFVSTSWVTPIAATTIIKIIAFACANPNSLAPNAEL